MSSKGNLEECEQKKEELDDADSCRDSRTLNSETGKGAASIYFDEQILPPNEDMGSRLSEESGNDKRSEHDETNPGELVPSDPVSDIINATTRELSHAYRQASDYVRNYSIDETEGQDNCSLQ